KEAPAFGINDIMAKSINYLGACASESGVLGFIVPDLPLNESMIWHQAFAPKGLDLITLVGPNTSLMRMREYAKTATGYVYVVSTLGVTGVRDGLPSEVRALIKQAHEVFDLPLALGFGIKDPRQLKGLSGCEAPEAVVFGSALLEHLKAGHKAADFMRLWL
ncbi:MAG: tryptophan synthase subunit alpha, partial [Candidatus Adiutrix sp.]